MIKLVSNGTKIDFDALPKTPDGALVMNAIVMRDGDYEYLGFEIPGAEERGYKYDDVLIGHMAREDVEPILADFEGLTVTDGHVFVNAGERRHLGSGTVLREGTLNDAGQVSTRVEVHDPDAIVKIVNGDARELSIGFGTDLEWLENRADGDPHFRIRNINLNHVAIVEQGRAGHEARLSHHMSTLKDHEMKKILVNGVEYEVADEVAGEIESLSATNSELSNSVSELTKERDTALGKLSVATTELGNSKNGLNEAAAKLALAHTKFVDEATRMGHESADTLALGDYDEKAVKAEILHKAGVAVPEEASADYINAAWDVSLANADKPAKVAALDLLNHSPSDNIDNRTVAEQSDDKFNSHYFGGSKSNA